MHTKNQGFVNYRSVTGTHAPPSKMFLLLISTLYTVPVVGYHLINWGHMFWFQK